jgi:deoxyribodipyrimidine photo-lyase
VWCAFVFDRAILDPLPRADRRVEFIRDSLVGVDAELRALGAAHGIEGVGLLVRHGSSPGAGAGAGRQLGVQAVYASHDDEPAALARDARVRGLLADAGMVLHTVKDHVIFERSEVLTQSGSPYGVHAVQERLAEEARRRSSCVPYPVARHAGALAPLPRLAQAGVPTLADIGFERTNLHQLRLPSGPAGAQELLDDFLARIDRYADTRDFPAIKGPSYLSTHLRFGTVSIRRLAREAHQRMAAGSRGAEVWLSELIWRDFYHQVLHHHPHVVGHAFKREYDKIRWEHGKHADALVCRLVRRPHRLPAGGRGDAPDQRDRLHAQPPAHGGGQLPDQGPGDRLAARRGLLRPAPERLRPGRQQRRLAVGGPAAAMRSPTSASSTRWRRARSSTRRAASSAATCRNWRTARQADARALAARPVDLVAAGVVLGRDYPEPVVQHELARMQTLERYAVVKSPA